MRKPFGLVAIRHFAHAKPREYKRWYATEAQRAEAIAVLQPRYERDKRWSLATVERFG
jgi:hypothetical protein